MTVKRSSNDTQHNAKKGGHHADKHRHRKKVCEGRTPIAPTCTGSYLRTGHRHNVHSARVKWDEITADANSFTVRIDKYILEWQRSDNGTTGWADEGRATVPAKDQDQGASDNYRIHKIRPKKYYRVRVRAVARGGCLGTWSAWVSLGADDPTPPSVTSLTLDIDESRAEITWDMPADADNTGIHDRLIDHVWVELWKTSLGGTLIGRDKRHHGERKHFSIPKPGTATFYARVYTVSDEGTQSAAATTSATKNTPSSPTVTIAFDSKGTRESILRGLVTVVPVTATDRDIDSYVVRFVHKGTNATPTTGDKRQVRHVEADSASDDLTAVFRGVDRGEFTFASARSIDTSGKKSAWSSWVAGGAAQTSNGPNSGLTIVSYVDTEKRIGVRWSVPSTNENPDITHNRIMIQVSKSSSFSPLLDQAKVAGGDGTYRYAVPRVDRDTIHYIRIRALTGEGNAGSWLPSATGQAIQPGPDEGDVAVPGTIRKRGGPNVPTGWLNCDGTQYATATYPDLFAAIGYAHVLAGEQSGQPSMFRVPDMKGRHPVGVGVNHALGATDGLAEASRTTVHQHSTDDTDTAPTSDATSQSVTSDATGGIPGSDATEAVPGSDATAATNPTDATPEAGHSHSYGGDDTGGPSTSQFNISAGGSQHLATDTHTHNLSGRTSGGGSNHGHGHQHASHPHPHGHGTHPHPHGHGTHGHGHGHGGHGHGHGHGQHRHGHGHDNKQRPHKALHFEIKT